MNYKISKIDNGYLFLANGTTLKNSHLAAVCAQKNGEWFWQIVKTRIGGGVCGDTFVKLEDQTILNALTAFTRKEKLEKLLK